MAKPSCNEVRMNAVRSSGREAARAGFLALLLALAALPAAAQDWRTSSSLTGDSKYGETFARYDYVNPQAPKGGTLNSAALGTFDSFNPYIVQGTPAAGLANFGGGLLYETLMEQATDEASVSHPLLAEAYKYPNDFSSATYRLDPNARWQDGEPVTVDDVIWSFEKLKAISPLYGRYYANVTEAVPGPGEREILFRFDQKGNRELPKILGDLTVLPRHWWEGTDANGRKRDVSRPTLEPPLGSGAYRIASFKPGAEIVWERVKDYWGAKLPVKLGRENFDRRRYTYFADENAGWLAFTKGGIADFRLENRAQRWAIDYTFPAFKAGDVVKREFASDAPEPMQAYVLNARRPQLADPRVRQALTYAFDFETMNRTLFYNSYTRTDSYFEGGELASTGLPEGKELEILEPFRAQLPPDLFTSEFKLPIFDTPQATRQNLRRASELLRAAGWTNSNGRLVNAQGQSLDLEFLGNDPIDERVALPFIDNLKRIGVNASLRIVDASQYVARVNNFDYDALALQSMAQSASPGNEQRDFWSAKAADTPGSRNYAGIRSPVVDALVDRVIFAADRDDLVAATHALDRVLLWNFYVVPQWHVPTVRTAYWNKFGIPEGQPAYSGIDLDSWWIEPERERALSGRYGGGN
jgi:microcin C transport system substrate-binding protein